MREESRRPMAGWVLCALAILALAGSGCRIHGGDWIAGAAVQPYVWTDGSRANIKGGFGGEVHFGWREHQEFSEGEPLKLETFSIIGRMEASVHDGDLAGPDASYYRLLAGLQVDFLLFESWRQPIFRLEAGVAGHLIDSDPGAPDIWGTGAYVSPGIGIWLEKRVMLSLDVPIHFWFASKGGFSTTVMPSLSATVKF